MEKENKISMEDIPEGRVRIALVTLTVECMVKRSENSEKVWVKPIPRTHYLCPIGNIERFFGE